MAQQASNVFDSEIRAWLSAMEKARHIKPGGKLVFINRKTGTVVPMTQNMPTQNLPSGVAGRQKVRVDPIAELRGKGMILGKPKRGRR